MASKSKMTDRAFDNPYIDYEPEFQVFDFETSRLIPEIEGPLLENVFILLDTLERHLKTELDWGDYSVYTGTSGISLLYLRFLDLKIAREAKPDQDFLNDAMKFIMPIVPNIKKKRFSFLYGCPGPLSILSVIFHKKGSELDADDLQRRVVNLEDDVVRNEMPDDVLFGRAGFLYALLYLDRHLPVEEDNYRRRIIKQTVNFIVDHGMYLAKKFCNTEKIPLYFEWSDRVYVGSAHGLAGVLFMLLQAREFLTPDQMNGYVRPSIDHLLKLQLPSGNFTSSLQSKADKLVHWCHGAPGVIYTLLMAYQVFPDDNEKYLEASIKISDTIWKRGFLKKGYGLCHGAAGNGYAHLRLFQVTKDVKYLYRAVKFAEWCFDYGQHGCRTPDRPLSLFEGFAGTIYYLLDLLDPLNAGFPAYQLV